MKLKPKHIRRKWKSLYPQFKHKHKLIVMDANTYVEKFSFNLTGINLFIIIGLSIIFLILITTLIIAFSPLREYIPGYSNPKQERRSYDNRLKIDSLNNYIRMQELMINNIKMVVSGEDIPNIDHNIFAKDSLVNYDYLTLKISNQDSLFRLYIKNQEKKYNQNPNNEVINSYNLSLPIKGQVINDFNKDRHIGIDIKVGNNQAIMSIEEGIVLMAVNTHDDKKIIIIQHPKSLISIYKNCQSLLKNTGEIVKKGEVIGFSGTGGRCLNSPYLHFELWQDSKLVNPLDYIKL